MDTSKTSSSQNLERRYEYLINNITDVIFEMDLSGVITYVSPQVKVLLDYNPDELISTNALTLVDPEDANMISEAFDQARDLNKVITVEFRLIHKSGKRIYVSSKGSSVKRNGNESLITVVRDISQEKENAQILQASEEKYLNLFQNNPYSILLINYEGTILDLNPSIEKLMGYSREEVLGQNFLKLPIYDPKMVDLLKIRLKQYSQKVKLKPIELKLYKKDGSSIWVNPSVNLIKIGNENIIQIIFNDITEKKETQLKLKEAYDKENFYKNLFTHDISNILTNILSSVSLLTLYLKAPMRKKDIEEIILILNDQVKRGVHLVSNVRTLSQLSEAEILLKIVNTVEILKHAENSIIDGFPDKNIKINHDYPKAKFIVKANDLLINVFENILTNSIRHNNNLNIEITVRISKIKKESIPHIKFEFIDNGTGVPDEIKEIIFKKGYEHKKDIRGLGFGLSLVKRIINQYNGEIFVEDRVKGIHTEGSNFIILIPAHNGK